MLSSVLCLTQGPLMVDLQLTTPLQWPILIVWGGVRSPLLDSLSRSNWEWCKLRKIFISAQNIPGKVNTQAPITYPGKSPLIWSGP